MARRFGFLQPLTDEEVNAESPALARVIQGLVGGAAHLYELVSGTPASNDSQVTPPNPQGEIGVDLSGPPWGSALRHPIAWIGGMPESTSIGYGRTPACVVKSTGGQNQIGPWCFWVRPFEHLPSPRKAPYSFGRVDIRAHRIGGLSATLQVAVRNLSIDGSAPEFTPGNQATVLTSEDNIAFSGGAMYVPLIPGWNTILLAFKNDSTVDIHVDSVVVNQVVKRSH